MTHGQRIITALRDAPSGLSSAQLIDLLYADDPTGGALTAKDVIKTTIWALRKKLSPSLAIKNYKRRYVLLENGCGLPNASPRDVLTPQKIQIYDLICSRPNRSLRELAALVGASEGCIGAQIFQSNALLKPFGQRLCGHPYRGYELRMIG